MQVSYYTHFKVEYLLNKINIFCLVGSRNILLLLISKIQERQSIKFEFYI